MIADSDAPGRYCGGGGVEGVPSDFRKKLRKLVGFTNLRIRLPYANKAVVELYCKQDRIPLLVDFCVRK